jgi:hypothetical protein
MQKQKLVMVSSKVLNQMLAYRKHNRYFASYKEACESIYRSIKDLREDRTRFLIQKGKVQHFHSLSLRIFKDQLVSIAAKCLLTAAECSGEHKLYDEVFNTFFDVAGEMMDQLVEEGDQYYDNAVIEKFEDFNAGVESGHANTVLLYHISVYCLFLYNYIDANSNPVAVEVKK